MKFGFDIDDTLIDLRRYGFQLYNKKLQMDVPIENFGKISTVEIHSLFGMTDAEGSLLWKSSVEELYFNECPIFEGALETLQALHAAGHEIYYITSRPKEACSRTRQWMVQQGFPVKEGHFYCGMEDHEKITTIQSLELDYYFDDKPAVLETLKETATDVFVIDQSYNQKIDLPRLVSWADFGKLVTLK